MTSPWLERPGPILNWVAALVARPELVAVPGGVLCSLTVVCLIASTRPHWPQSSGGGTAAADALSVPVGGIGGGDVCASATAAARLTDAASAARTTSAMKVDG